MSVHLPDLILEATIRDGIEFIRQNPEVLDDVFGFMLKGYANTKYGQTEITKIKTLFTTKNIAVVHSFYEAEAKTPCYSIQLGAEAEAKDRAMLGDFSEEVQEEFTSAEDLASMIRVDDFIPSAYDPVTGRVSVSDDFNLSLIHPGYNWVDGSENSFTVLPGISNQTGNKFFFIARNQSPDLVNEGTINTFLNYRQYEVRSDTSGVNILIGVHTKDALLTKYLYVILKYIMKSRKPDLIKRGLVNSSFQGSDFTRDLRYEGDMIFTRFFTVSGQVSDTWRSDNVDLIDNVIINATPVDCPEDD